MTILSGVGASGSVGPTSGGKVYGYNALTTAPSQVAPANPSRIKITFHNPGPADIFVAPALIQTTGSSVAFAPTTNAVGGCFRVYGNGGTLVIEGECQGAWNAFMSAGTGPITVMDTNR